MATAPSSNIAAIQNLGTERYECFNSAGLCGFIDVFQNENGFRAFTQIGRDLSGLEISVFDAKTKKKAVKMAFEWVYFWFETEDNYFTDQLYCPDILKGSKLNIQRKQAK